MTIEIVEKDGVLWVREEQAYMLFERMKVLAESRIVDGANTEEADENYVQFFRDYCKLRVAAMKLKGGGV